MKNFRFILHFQALVDIIKSTTPVLFYMLIHIEARFVLMNRVLKHLQTVHMHW